MGYPYKPSNSAIYLTLRVVDVGTAETLIFSPGFRGRIRRATSCIAGAITGADSTWKLQVNTTDVTGSTATVTQSGSAAGDVDTVMPTALNTFTETDHLRLVNAGESTGAQVMWVTLELEPI